MASANPTWIIPVDVSGDRITPIYFSHEWPGVPQHNPIRFGDKNSSLWLSITVTSHGMILQGPYGPSSSSFLYI